MDDGTGPGTQRQAGVTWGACGSFRRQGAGPESHQRRFAAEAESWRGVDVDDLVLSTSHRYPDRTVSLHFYRCRLLGLPKPQLGQQMQWVTRAELGALEFPPADADLIAVLSGS